MRKPKTENIELPAELEALANDLVRIVATEGETHFQQMITQKEEEPKSKTHGLKNWEDVVQKHSISENVEEWSSKDFVHWFVSNLHSKLNLPYIIEYSRDCAAIKRIKDQLLLIGYNEQLIIKSFLTWGMDNYSYIKQNNERFDLPTIGRFLNDFIQQELVSSDDINPVERMLTNIYKDVLDIVKHKEKAMTELLIHYGIPITGQCYIKTGNGAEKINNGIANRLNYFLENDIMKLEDVARRSIDYSPYPQVFAFIDWRERYKAVWVSVSKQRWWRNNDYGGKPAAEYNKFIGNGE
jgi:hypothetical protein